MKPCSIISAFRFWRQLRFFQFSLRFLLQFPDSFICFANVGCSPTPRQHFCKTAAPKNFLVACGSLLAVCMKKLSYWCHVSCETLWIAPRKTTRNWFGKAGAHPQLAWESQLSLKPCISLQPLDFKGNCDSSDFLLDFCFVSRCSFDLLRKCGLLAHTSAAFLKNCCTEKLFIRLRLVACSHVILMQCFMWNILRMHIQQVLKKRWKLAWF